MSQGLKALPAWPQVQVPALATAQNSKSRGFISSLSLQGQCTLMLKSLHRYTHIYIVKDKNKVFKEKYKIF